MGLLPLFRHRAINVHLLDSCLALVCPQVLLSCLFNVAVMLNVLFYNVLRGGSDLGLNTVCLLTA